MPHSAISPKIRWLRATFNNNKQVCLKIMITVFSNKVGYTEKTTKQEVV